MISSQIFSSKLQRVFTLGDGCWLPIIRELEAANRLTNQGGGTSFNQLVRSILTQLVLPILAGIL